mmetsp:Transcript_36231/g.86326  ORF Transcript_36231/g.86326 Transcript_36231/m.86326 type:complete len:249 (+) Transcript_36231:145-891(+)
MSSFTKLLPREGRRKINVSVCHVHLTVPHNLDKVFPLLLVAQVDRLQYQLLVDFNLAVHHAAEVCRVLRRDESRVVGGVALAPVSLLCPLLREVPVSAEPLVEPYHVVPQVFCPYHHHGMGRMAAEREFPVLLVVVVKVIASASSAANAAVAESIKSESFATLVGARPSHRLNHVIEPIRKAIDVESLVALAFIMTRLLLASVFVKLECGAGPVERVSDQIQECIGVVKQPFYLFSREPRTPDMVSSN